MKCIFCYNQQRTKFHILLWKQVYSIRTSRGLFFYTVCPDKKCRSNTIDDIHKALLTRNHLFVKKLL